MHWADGLLGQQTTRLTLESGLSSSPLVWR